MSPIVSGSSLTPRTSGLAKVGTPLPLDSGRITRLELVTRLDLARVGVKTDVVTDATVAVDARHVTIRTYGTGLEYDVPAGAPLASIWSQTPRIFKIQDPPQGEGISYRLDGNALLFDDRGLLPGRRFGESRSCAAEEEDGQDRSHSATIPVHAGAVMR